MTGPRLSDRALLTWVVAAAAAFMVVVAAVVVDALSDALSAPILPATEPATTGTAAQIPPCRPVELTAVPMHGWGPR